MTSILNKIARYSIPTILGAASLLYVESNGISAIQQELANKKAQVSYEYHDYVDGINMTSQGFIKRVGLDAMAFGIPFGISLFGIEKLISKKKK